MIKAPIVIFDVEATCDSNMPRKKRELIEIGAIKVVDGEIIDTFQIIIKPKRNPTLSKYCMDLTHISQEQINHGISPREALNSFATWANDCILAAWGEFDQEIIEKEMHKNKIDKYFYYINLKKLYVSAKHLPMTTSLFEVLKREKISLIGEQHRAYHDAYNTYLVYTKNRKAMDNMMKQLYSYHFS